MILGTPRWWAGERLHGMTWPRVTAATSRQAPLPPAPIISIERAEELPPEKRPFLKRVTDTVFSGSWCI